MITCNFWGRLGNSMFQIAACVGHAKRYGYQYGFPPYDNRRGRPWESGIWNCFPNIPRFEGGMPNFHEHPNEHCNLHGVHKDICHYDYHPIPAQDNICLNGFFQSYRYFENVQDDIKTLFSLPHVPGFEDYVSIHVRRGDYVQHAESFPPITVEYVEQAMNKIRTGKVIVFSDDIGWCKTAFDHLNTTQCRIEFSEGRGEKEDLSLMASCGHHIIANSTYSWWGAYLGHNPDRIVICPSIKRGQWYGMNSGVKKDCVDLVPPNWIQIER